MASLSTRKQIRRRAGDLTGDMLLLKATASGSDTTFVDALNLAHESGLFINRQGIFSAGTAGNIGSIVRATANDKSTTTLTFTPAVAASTAAADELELWNQRDEGLTPDTIHRLINDAIADAAEFGPVPVTSDAFDFHFDSPTIDIDTLEVATVADGLNWEVITGADWQDDLDNWIKIPTVSSDFLVDREARTITIGGRSRWLADGHQIRVRGANLPVALTADTDTTSLNFEWITAHVAAHALEIRLEKAFDRKEVEGNMLRLQQRADTLRTRIPLRLRGRFWRLS